MSASTCAIGFSVHRCNEAQTNDLAFSPGRWQAEVLLGMLLVAARAVRLVVLCEVVTRATREATREKDLQRFLLCVKTDNKTLCGMASCALFDEAALGLAACAACFDIPLLQQQQQQRSVSQPSQATLLTPT